MVRTMADRRAETTDEEDPPREEDILDPARGDLCVEDLCRAEDLCAEGPCPVGGLCHVEDRCVEDLCHAEDHEAAGPCPDPAAAFRLLAEEAVHPLLWRPHLILQVSNAESTGILGLETDPMQTIDPTILVEAATQPSPATHE